ncbi:hypothetical protein ACLIYP_20495 [Streptomyces nanhaiensis]|uniref:hypothetical protein n=1 Tax=Streptomyces nanhaiensis TaxID=679319 RepID=UPI00399D18E8
MLTGPAVLLAIAGVGALLDRPRAGLRDMAPEETPERSGTLKGTEWDAARIRTEMLARQRTVLVTDAEDVSKPASSARDRVKTSTLREYFRPVAHEQVRGRQVTVYGRRTPGRPS